MGVGQHHASQETVVDGLHCLLLLLLVVELDPVVHVQDLHYLPLLLLTLALLQQVRQLLQLLVINTDQVQLLVQGLRDGRLLLRTLHVQSIGAVLLQGVDLEFELNLLAQFEDHWVTCLQVTPDEVEEGVGSSSIFESFIELVDRGLVCTLLGPHHVPTNEDELLVEIHVVLGLAETEGLILDHEIDDV